jgi:hypothetical protein
MSEEDKKKNRSQYMKSYYEENRDKILERRKLRYANEAEYRKKINTQRRNTRRRKQKLDNRYVNLGDSIRDEGEPMKIYNPERTHYAIVRMYTVGRVADLIGVPRTQFYSWLHKGRIPEANYVKANGWRLYTEYEMRVLKRIVRSAKISLSMKAYQFRMNQRLKEEIFTQLNALVGGVPASAFTETDTDTE